MKKPSAKPKKEAAPGNAPGRLSAFRREKWPDMLVMGLFAFLTFIFLTRSPLHPWNLSSTGIDSSVYKTVALMMGKGYAPYRYSFDHKGPVIYLINCLGNLIAPYRGVWVLEYVSLFAAAVICYRTMRDLLHTGEVMSAVAVLTGLSLLFVYFQGGNFTEEYAMPFIAAGNYVFLNYLLHDRYTPFQLCVCGFSFAAVLLLRINMVGLWVVFCLDILILMLIRKNIKALFVYIGWFSLGMGVVVVPVLCWLGAARALKDFWFDYVRFNLIYSSSEGGRATAVGQWDALYYFFNTTVFAAAFLSSLFLAAKSRRSVWLVYALMLVFNLATICISGMKYDHYGMILIPILIIPVGGMFSYLTEHGGGQPAAAYLLAGFLLCTVIWGDWAGQVNAAGKLYRTRSKDHIPANVKTVTEIIKSNTAADDAISVYGNYDIIYVLTGRRHATRYSYQYPIGKVYPPIMEEYWKALHEEHPKFIVVQKGRYDEDIAAFLERDHYELLWAEKADSINGGIALFAGS